MKRGCPQGSSFGPLMWNIFQNDMSCSVRDANLTMYADDHQLYITAKDHDKVGAKLKTQGLLAQSWYRNNFLLANPDKFQLMTINPRNLDPGRNDATMEIDDQSIDKTSQIKLLGVN